ncbi:hypothetical protein Pla123a_37190 [Posidoniimonas polymericola]|uniref:DUF1772 domain-containing protein n=1 Tax=Posidoniimonas polymericola TaxID=2528002 RepID=A0A5C5YH32_9BACT|nr:hypothetical protein [Posidoniimonas polymericola]TWT73825.1 hypothetical protein Pla123a_37190 [Posidoniimonas polymericola]
MPVLLFVLQLAATLIMVGLIWFVQLVHYPLLGAVGEPQFAEYEQAHCRLTGYVVIPPMLVELATAAAMLAWRPDGVPRWVPLAGMGLLAVVWLSTFVLQAPAHGRLVGGYEAATHHLLVASNWLRTSAWTARGGLLGWVCWQLLSAQR